jgi:hypothetical protein
MVKRGFRPCHSDPCVYTKQGVVVLMYVDDMLIFSRSMNKIKKLIHSLDDDDEYTDEGNIRSYLGIAVSNRNLQAISAPPLKKHLSGDWGYEAKFL